MAVLTIGGKDYPAALNLRAARLFEQRTGRTLAALLQEVFGGNTTDISASLVTAAVDALIHFKRDCEAPSFDELEESLDAAALPILLEQVVGLIQENTKAVAGPLARMAEKLNSLQTGEGSGPSDIAA